MHNIARQHAGVFRVDVDRLAPVPGTHRVAIRSTQKSRFAVVRARYNGSVGRAEIFDHYRRVLAAQEWRPCGQSADELTYCKGEYEAIVSVPSSDGAGIYSVALQWNRITWPVWLVGCALIFAAAFSVGRLLDDRRPLRFVGRDTVHLASRLSFSESLTRLKAANSTNVLVRLGETSDDRMIFGLQKRGGRFIRTMVAPFFYGRLNRIRRAQAQELPDDLASLQKLGRASCSSPCS
jgi:hypothetical protein